jgi:hypothetical protein
MRTISTLSATFIAATLAIGCESTVTQPGPDMAELAPAFSVDAVVKPLRSINPVLLWNDPSQQVGSSTLLRTRQGVSFDLQTSSLTRDEVVTLWMVVFNNPEHCDGGCDIPDFFNPAVQADALYAGGRVIGGSGTANYAGHRNVGDSSGSIFPAWLGLPAYGIIDSHKAEIHFVVHTHGPKIPGLVGEMLHTFNAGCAPEFMEIPVPEELGTHGPNTCEDVQFTVHTPPVF